MPEVITKKDLMRILDNAACINAFNKRKCKDVCKDCPNIALSYWEILEKLEKLGD